MYKVCGTRIEMVRGDTFVAVVSLCRDHEPYIPSEHDVIKFAAKRACEVKTRLVKIVPNDTMELCLLPEDTKDLPIGLYKYDMQIELENGDIDTFISSGELILRTDICRE